MLAGNDTTRQTASHAVLALQDHPEQKAALLADFDGRIDGAVDEFVRAGNVINGITRLPAPL